MALFKVLLVCVAVGCAAAAVDVARNKFQADPLKQAFLKRHARQAPATAAPATAAPVQPSTIAVPTNMAEACSSAECNNRGTCFGTKQSPICLCQIGFAGTRCEDTYCDSARDCSGHGLCMGTQRQFSCLCNLGFTGERCETEAPPMVLTAAPVTVAPAATVAPAVVPRHK